MTVSRLEPRERSPDRRRDAPVRTTAAAAPSAAPAPPQPEPPAAVPDGGRSPLSDVLARAIAARPAPGGVMLMRAEGDGTAVVEPEQVGPSSEQRALLMTTFGLTAPARLDDLLRAAHDDVAGLLRLGRGLAAKGAGVALALRLLRRASATQAANLVAAARHPARLPQLLYCVPNAELLRTLLLFEDEQDPMWLVRVCTPVALREQPMLPVLLEHLPRAAAPALLALERPSVLLGLLRGVEGPAALVTVLPLVPDRALLKRCLALEPRAAVLAPLCSRMSVDRDDLPRLLELVPDRGLLLRLVTAESDGRRLVELLRLAGDPAILERLLRDVRNRTRLQNALNAVAAELGPGRAAAAAVEVLVQANLLGVVADQARLQRVLAIVEMAQGYGADAMREVLDEAAEFDYHWAFGITALESANDEIERLVKDERERLEALDATAIEQAIAGKKDAATASKLSKTERKQVGLYGETGDKVRKKLRAGQEELAQDDIARINEKTDKAVAQYRAGPAALAGRARKQAYVDYFKAIGFDPDALKGLAATDDDLGEAQRLFGAIATLPGLRAAALGKTLGVAALERLAGLADPPRSGLVANVPVPTLKAFAATDERTALLSALGTAAVPTLTIVAVGKVLASLDAHIAPTQHAALVALLGAYSADEIQTLLSRTPGPAKLTFLNTMRPRCTDYAALKTGLDLARRSKWSQAKILNEVPAGHAPMDATAIRTAICDGRADEFDKDTDFRNWVDAIALLIEDGYCTFSRTTAVYLPKLGDLGDTIESVVTVVPLGVTFVLHTHPNAKETSSATSSKYHIKSERGNKHTPRVYRSSLPDAIASRLPGLKGMYTEANYS